MSDNHSKPSKPRNRKPNDYDPSTLIEDGCSMALSILVILSIFYIGAVILFYAYVIAIAEWVK